VNEIYSKRPAIPGFVGRRQLAVCDVEARYMIINASRSNQLMQADRPPPVVLGAG
jgi:hypothetical protein